MEIHPERNRKHRLPKVSHDRIRLGMVRAKIRTADASLSPFTCSLAAVPAASHGRSSLLTAQNVSFEPQQRQAANNQ